MASKIFMGDMPELMEIILNNLNEEIYSLHSCALVSRHWCKMSIPLLWRNPFSFHKNPMFISNYISSPEDIENNEKSILAAYGIFFNFPNTIFPYARFLKVLDLSLLNDCVEKWINIQLHYEKIYIETLKYYLANSLLKIFIKYGAVLSRLDLNNLNNFIGIKSDIFDLLEPNINFFSNIHILSVSLMPSYDLELKLDFEFKYESYCEYLIKLLKILVKSVTKIIDMRIELYELYNSDYLPQLCHELICIIKSQEDLKYFDFFSDRDEPSREFYGIIMALKSQKKALKGIMIKGCTYNTEFKALRDCENLEVARISHCNNEIFNTFNSKIRILEISPSELDDASGIIQVLKKSGSLLQRFKLDLEYSYLVQVDSQSLLLETLMTSCPNITYLCIFGVKDSTHFLKLLSSLQRLQFLTLSWDDELEVMKKEKAEERIKQLAEILPPKLLYLDLSKENLGSHISILLDHCDAPLKKLSFFMSSEENINAIIRFCIRKKTLNIVSIVGLCWDKIKKDLEEYVKLVPYNSFVVNCL